MPNELFISKRIFKSDVQGKKVSSPIVRISVISIALAIVVNLITLSVVNGFQNEVRQKITGFGAHFFIRKNGTSSNYDSSPILKNQKRINDLKKMKGVKAIFPVAFKPAILQSGKVKRNVVLNSGKDSSYISQDVQGVVFKGVESGYNLKFFNKYLIDGNISDFLSDNDIPPVLISEKTATTLSYNLNDTINVFFVRSKPIKQNFVVKGIYNSGLEEFDKKIVITKLSEVQKLNDWGLNAEITIADTLFRDRLVISSFVSGGEGNYFYNWGGGYQLSPLTFSFFPTKDTTLTLIVKENLLNGSKIPQIDTAKVYITCSHKNNSERKILLDDSDELIKTYNDSKGYDYTIAFSDNSTARIKHEISKTSNSENYVSGFELYINAWDELNSMNKSLKKHLELIPSEDNTLIEVKSIVDNEKDLFLWLSFLDLNVLIILVLMLLIAIINIGSAMLVIIVVRTNFIGVLKALGTSNWSIRKIFLMQASFLILRGMLWGNLIGLGLCFLQMKFGLISLNPEVYYLNAVPIKINFYHLLLLNIGTILICLLALLLPSFVVTKINPKRAIKFD